jgi:cation diffusion facilitator family transporter
MTAADREVMVRKALRLEQLSIAWMVVEGGASIVAGIVAHSVALIGFGFDSVLELVSAIALYRRLNVELRHASDEQTSGRSEQAALWVVGVTLLLLCAYIVVEGGLTLWTRSAPEQSPIGLGVAAIALVAMPLLGRAKLRLGKEIGSRALVGDAKETLACAWLSGAVMIGVGLNAVAGWWWADPVAALAMVPLIAREGWEALGVARGVHDDDD